VTEHDAGRWRNGVRRRELPLSFSKTERARRREWSGGAREELGQAAGKARARVRGPSESQLLWAHGGHTVAALCNGRAQARARGRERGGGRGS
jgi:hypothetical protein